MKHRLMLRACALSCLLLVSAMPTLALEGMWTPEQLPDVNRQLRDAGLKMKVDQLTDLTAFPMGAVISLGGCTASFVSPTGLVVTNYHCARGSIQFNSTEEKNYLAEGFVAQTKADELQAAPGTRVYVTTRFEDVTAAVEAELRDDMGGRERYQAIEDKRKALIAECEARPGYRCQVETYYGGASYKLIERLEIRDVRIAYAPAGSIGEYGGDIDNWQWPRHTGDFAFYRAYVGPDGAPADYSEDNVPFEPDHFLKVSREGLDDGDFVMAAGYPGRTRRYARLSEVENTFDWVYPAWKTLAEEWIATIEAASPEGSDARIKYESLLAGLNNYRKNLGGQIEGAERVGLTQRRADREAALDAWVSEESSRAEYAAVFEDLDSLVAEMNLDERSDFWYDRVTRPSLLGAAQQLYRLAKEKEKPDAERESGYQERDMTFLKQRMEVIERRYDPTVDKAQWLQFLDGYLGQPAEQRVEAFDAALELDGSDTERQELSATLDSFYTETRMGDVDTRLAWMDRPPADFEASDDPFIALAVALYDYEIAEEEEAKTFSGRMSQLRPLYMNAITAYAAEQGLAVYPDANSTLRVTFGRVFGGSPKDGLVYESFTRVEGIPEKNTGKDPFDAPSKQLEAIAARDYGAYQLKSLGTVPVNFLSDLDVTGGNSGSATLDANGNLVGLLFDMTIESVNSDWDFDPRTARTIHVDSRYLLWVMEKLDDAGHLVDEMTLTKTR